MTFQELKELCKPTMEHGPTRVVINAEGEATAPNRAPAEPDVIFVRNDGWSLGAPVGLIKVAEQMWSDQWVGVLVRGEPFPLTYEAWKAVNQNARDLVP